jgi:hypothetical protein
VDDCGEEDELVSSPHEITRAFQGVQTDGKTAAT